MMAKRKLSRPLSSNGTQEMASQHKLTHENPLGQHAQAPWMNNMQKVCAMNIKILFHPYNRLKVEMCCCIVAQNLNPFKKKHIMHQCRI
jgi:hypothetical protein